MTAPTKYCKHFIRMVVLTHTVLYTENIVRDKHSLLLLRHRQRPRWWQGVDERYTDYFDKYILYGTSNKSYGTHICFRYKDIDSAPKDARTNEMLYGTLITFDIEVVLINAVRCTEKSVRNKHVLLLQGHSLEDISADEILSGTLKKYTRKVVLINYVRYTEKIYKKGRSYECCTAHWKYIQERSYL